MYQVASVAFLICTVELDGVLLLQLLHLIPLHFPPRFAEAPSRGKLRFAGFIFLSRVMAPGSGEPLDLSSPPMLKSIARACYNITWKEESCKLKSRTEQHRCIL